MEKDLKQIPSSLFRVVLYGPESTGKTTLTKQLAAHYQTVCVEEFARDYLQKKWNQKKEVCTQADLAVIVSGQLQLENQAIANANQILFCDTNVVVTRVWSETHFDGYCDPQIIAYSEQFQYDLYFLTGIDVPWQKDDLRDRPNDRQMMFDYFKNTLDKLQKNYVLLQGNQEQRLEKAIGVIDQLLKKT
jgi:NadR type nicotinamide-nucleotide adenylyltransferase|tara:strand:+ start:3013 stop:3579 length:567 start_codon:yes stop_codon:yes gene_type:complete